MTRRRVQYTALTAAPERPAPTYPEYEQLLADAKAALATEGMFIDPANVYRVKNLPRSWEWRVCVLGHAGDRSRLDMHLLLLAHDRDLDPPLPQWLVDARADDDREDQEKAAARAERDEQDRAAWEKVAAGCAVELEVRRNGTTRIRFGHRHQLGHAVPPVDVLSGDGRRHPAGRALCETEQRSKALDLSGEPGGPVTCGRCLAWVPKIRPA